MIFFLLPNLKLCFTLTGWAESHNRCSPLLGSAALVLADPRAQPPLLTGALVSWSMNLTRAASIPRSSVPEQQMGPRFACSLERLVRASRWSQGDWGAGAAVSGNRCGTGPGDSAGLFSVSFPAYKRRQDTSTEAISFSVQTSKLFNEHLRPSL